MTYRSSGNQPPPRPPASGRAVARASVPGTTPPGRAGPPRDGKGGRGRGKGGRGKGRPPKRRSPLWAKLLIAFGVLVVLGSGGAIVAVRAGLNAISGSINQGTLLDPAAAAPKPQIKGSTIQGPLNILMVGVDASGVRTDSIIIAHIPATHDKVYLVSLPRDTRVNTPQGGTNKINSTFDAGFANLAATIKLNYGITFNAGMTVNFDGFKDIVTKLHGIDLYVDETTHSIHHGYINNDPKQHAKPYNINPQTGVPICYDRRYIFDTNPDKCTLPGVKEVTYPKGLYHFDAYDALDFVRCRDGLIGTDYGRQRHQQQFIKALMKKAYARGLNDPLKLNGLISALGKAFVFDRHGIPIDDWLFTLKGLSPDSVLTIRTNNGLVNSYRGDTGGAGSEQLLTDTSLQLLADIRDDRARTDLVGDFVLQHSDWVANG